MQIGNKNIPVKLIASGLAVVFVGVAAMDSVYKVEPNEVANIRRLNSVQFSTPVKSGTHMKLPFIDKVDRAQLSLRTLTIPTFSVNTIDNQKIDLDINFNYRLPVDKVNYLLYQVGQVDDANDDIDEIIIPVAMDRAARVFAQQNTTKISMDREAIQAEVTDEVFKAVRELFGLEPQSLQIAKIGYSDTFVQSNERAVANKNAAIAEENKKDVETAKANQIKIEAAGQADSQINAAKGEAQSIRLRAEAEKKSLDLEAEGEANRLRAEIAPFGDADTYLKYMEEQVKLKWNGKRPQVEVHGNGANAGGGATVVVPVPGLPRP
jgi:membrane protease subunit HflC